jgi:hypothetical protein
MTPRRFIWSYPDNVRKFRRRLASRRLTVRMTDVITHAGRVEGPELRPNRYQSRGLRRVPGEREPVRVVCIGDEHRRPSVREGSAA